MRFKVHKRTLLDVLTPIQAIVPTKTTLLTLQNLKLTARKGSDKAKGMLRFDATDLDVSLSRTITGKVEREGEILVPAKRLYEIVRELPERQIAFEQKDLTLSLTCDRCVFKLPGIDTEDYPQIPTAEASVAEGSLGIKLKAAALLRAISKVAFAISSDESRPALCGLLWQISKESMKLVATDGHRLAFISTGSFGEYLSSRKREGGSKEGGTESLAEAGKQLIVPQKALHLLEVMLRAHADQSEFEIDVDLAESKVGFSFSLEGGKDSEDGMSGAVYLSSRLISGVYPDYKSVLPKGNDRIVKVDREELGRSIRRVAIFSDPYTHLVKFSFGSGKIGLFSTSPQGGEAHDEVACEYAGEELEIGYNASYVMDVLKRIEDETVEIQLKSAIDAGIFVPSEQKKGEELLYLLMPIRLLGH